MSDSTPIPATTKPGLPFWWLLSGLGHALLLGGLALVPAAPARPTRPVSGSSSGSVTARPGEKVERTPAQEARALALVVHDLQDIQRKLAELETQRRRELPPTDHSPTGAPAAGASPPAPTSPEPMSLGQLYQTARQSEQAVAESYRQLSAIELAKIDQMPLDRALKMTEPNRAERPDLEPALAKGGNAEAARAAALTARAQINAMRALAASLLAQARDFGRNGVGSGTGAKVGLDGDGGPNGTGQGVGSATGNSGPIGPNLPLDIVGDNPPDTSDLTNARPGRIIAAHGNSSRWIFLDSWYVLGPFDNTGRKNLDTKFPPEDGVDLDATYEGKHGSTIRWEFYQAAEQRIDVPFPNYPEKGYGRLEYIVYYNYTEVRCAEACDLWMAVGSDDSSKLWVNDKLVYESGKLNRNWNARDGQRKVHFEAGINRILCRVDNDWGPTHFSVTIGMPQ